MPAHTDLTRAFHNGLFTGALPAGVTARSPDEAARRFDVYRNNVMHSLSRALATRFPVIERLVGEQFFAAMAREFIKTYPPQSPLIARYGTAMPAFLECFPPVSGLPYLPDVARLELARGEAYHAADAEPVAADVLARAAATGPDLRLLLHPSFRMIRSDWPVVSIWKVNQPDSSDPTLTANGAEFALIGRTPTLDVVMHPVDLATHDFLVALARTGSVSASALSAHADPTPGLALLIGAGLVTDATTGELP